ncbi:ABC transporter permease DevC [Roseomonas sp. GC11]|uniref:ABC transporter permease DevC n=1 Tax=Roseomonas sp. GC11 TaxID=2950546 RepID=UPI0021094DBB|nr:ABC transporter permease DevC [Roseomonas sp. GC11]MCQ4159716.1 ABC transporter permease DevC [Roseomonas sp. GC11]
MRPWNALWLPLRLAWRQLRAEKARLASAIAGVMFACVLVFMQLGFRAALFESATSLITAMRAEVFLLHPLTLASFRPEPLPRIRAWQSLALPEVERAVPVYLAQSTWRNPESGARRTIQLVGFDVEAGAMRFTGLDAVAEALKRPDTVAFDLRSRPEFGPVSQLLARRRAETGEAALPVQIANRRVEVVGLVEIGPSFGADGNVLLSETNFRRLVADRPASHTDLVALRLRPGAQPAAVRDRLAALLPADVAVLTYPELVAWELRYWETATPIGFIFAFGSLMGLIVGMVIVYQILFSDIAGHLREYATLKAIGYSNAYLGRVVLGAALLLAVLGFIPGALASAGLYAVVGQATFLPLGMTPERALLVFGLIFGMCALAGLLAMRKLRDADPADMF